MRLTKDKAAVLTGIAHSFQEAREHITPGGLVVMLAEDIQYLLEIIEELSDERA